MRDERGRFIKGHKSLLNQYNEKNNQWKGDEVGYSALHKWIKRVKGTPSKCEKCKTTKAKRFEWASISREYKRDVDDWMRLCPPCHRRYDLEWKR